MHKKIKSMMLNLIIASVRKGGIETGTFYAKIQTN